MPKTPARDYLTKQTEPVRLIQARIPVRLAISVKAIMKDNRLTWNEFMTGALEYFVKEINSSRKKAS